MYSMLGLCYVLKTLCYVLKTRDHKERSAQQLGSVQEQER